VEQASNVITQNLKVEQKFDLILCIEMMHCITNFEAVLQQASMLLSDSPDACFVLADGSVPGHRLAEHEDLLKRHFDIEVK